MMKLAINGAKNIRLNPWPERHLYNKLEIKETLSKIIDSDNLSGYRGSFGQHFYGGKYVRELEFWFEKYIFDTCGVKAKVLAVNSCTSALQIACGAIGLSQYDEVIVTPWSMTCSATAPLVYGANPVFADIEKDCFCLDPKNVESKITENTKAIIAVDLFGNPYAKEINDIAKKHNLYIIEDAAQALGAKRNGILTGVLGDIGCFSFTQGKHFTCGEGGFIVTKDDDLYYACALIRNHAEAVNNSNPNFDKVSGLSDFYGFNMRMTELQAAVLLKQFNPIYEKYYNYIEGKFNNFDNNIDYEIFLRRYRVEKLTKAIDIPFIKWCTDRQKCEHSYYVLPFLFDENKAGISRNKFIEAIKAELRIEKTDMGITQKIDPLIWEGYIKPIYQMPIFNKQILLPNVEELQNKLFCFTTFQSLPLSDNDIDDIASAFYKVAENIEELK